MPKLLLFFAKIINNVFGFAKGKTKYYNAWQYLHTISLQGMARIQGHSLEESGEKNILKEIAGQPGKKITIIDVGANKGNYTAMAIEAKEPTASLNMVLVEPSAVNIDLLKNRFLQSNSPGCNFFIEHMALSDTNGVAFLYADSEGSDLASLVDLKVAIRKFDDKKKETVKTMTLDEYSSVNNLETIDLLKIDVEGVEYKVLKGASRLIEEDKIKNIQFEFGAGNISSRQYFYDFWEMLSDKYDFYQVVSDGKVPIKKYSIDLEIFKTTNYFLSRKSG